MKKGFCIISFCFVCAAVFGFEIKKPDFTRSVFGSVIGENYSGVIHQFNPNFNPKQGFCYTQARMAFAPDGRGVFTMTALKLVGMDVYSGLFFATTKDAGKTWSEFKESKNVKRHATKEGNFKMLLDPTPIYHKQSDKFIIFGAEVTYMPDNKIKGKYSACFSFFNEKSNEWSVPQNIDLPFESSTAGSAQPYVEDNGTILLPISHKNLKTTGYGRTPETCILRCKVQNENIICIQHSNSISIPVPRGLGEPSIVKSGDEYFITMRNDYCGYIAKTKNPMVIDLIYPLCFDTTKAEIGNYNTQTHLVENNGKVFVVYTRRGANNDHVFRHRAPLFMAEVNKKNLMLKKVTERALTPNRGARMGNFGTNKISHNKWIVVAAEWMQGDKGWQGCMQHGSDNSIFATEIDFK